MQMFEVDVINIEKELLDFLCWLVEGLKAVVLLGNEPLTLSIKPVLCIRLSLLFAMF